MTSDERELLVPDWEADETAKAQPDGEFDFFISYTRSDLDWAKWIARELRKEELTVAYQHADFPPGEEFRPRIDEMISRARRVIAVVSKSYLGSKICRSEWDAAGDKILPVRIEEVDPGGLRGTRTFFDLFGMGGDDIARRARLLEAIAGRQPAPIGAAASFELPRRPSRFIGREHLLRIIFDHFVRTRPGRGTRRLTIAGMSGLGKTTVAVEYAHRTIESGRYENVWFVPAGQHETLQATLRSLVDAFRAPRRNVPLAEQVRDVLRSRSAWLLILDHARDLNAVSDYLPPAAEGHILITSENPATWGRSNVVQIDGWTIDESVDFLLAETGTEDRTGATRLAEEFDGHPDRLTQAASYIDRTGTSVRRYIQMQRDRQLETDDHFAAQLALALDELEGNPLALETLRLGAFLGPERVPIDLLVAGLQAAGRDVDDVRFDYEAVQPLIRFSLARRDDPHVTFSRLVQNQVRSSATQRGEAARWYGIVLGALDQLYPQSDDLRDPAVWPLAAELLPHALAVTEAARSAKINPGLTGKLLVRVARSLEMAEHLQATAGGRSGDGADHQPALPDAESGAALSLLVDARRLLESAHGPDHLDVSEAAAALGGLHRIHNRFDEAIDALTDAHEIASRVAGPESPIASMRLTDLARVQRDSGLATTARENLQTAIRNAEAAGESGNRTLAEALASYGIALSYLGRHREALEHLHRSLSLQEALFELKSFEIAITLQSLANVQAAYGDSRGAELSLQRTAAIEREAYGAESPFRVTGLLSAAQRALESQDPSGATALTEEVLSIVGEHSVAGDGVASMALVLQARADRDGGGTHWRDLLDQAAEAADTAGVPNVQPRLTLVEYLIADGLVGEAAALAQAVARDRMAAADWSNMVVARLALIDATAAGGAAQEAEEMARSLVHDAQIHEEVGGSLLIACHQRLGDALLGLDRVVEALDAFSAAYDQAIGQSHVIEQANTRLMQSVALLEMGRPSQARDWAREALDLFCAHLIDGHPAIVEARLVLAAAEAAYGREAEARSQLDVATDEAAARAGARSLEVGLVYLRAAESLAGLGLVPQAAARAEEALSIRREAAKSPSDSVRAIVDAGHLMLALGKRDRARELADESRGLVATGPDINQVERARAAELAVRVALADRDVKAARALVDQLLESLAGDPDISPRLTASIWMLSAEIAGDDQEAALHAVESALELGVDSFAMPRREIALNAAELKLAMGQPDESAKLIEQLLREEVDLRFRIYATDLLLRATIAAADHQRSILLIGELLQLIESEKDPILRARVHLGIAECQLDLNDKAAAVAALDLADEALSALADDTGPAAVRQTAELFEHVALLAVAAGDATRQTAALERAADRYRRLDDRPQLANVMTLLDLDWVKKHLPELEKDSPVVAVQANVGLRYLELGDYVQARDALEHAVEGYELQKEDEQDLALFLVPLAQACDALNDFRAAEGHVARAVECSLIDEERWEPSVLEAIVDMAELRTSDPDRYKVMEGLARKLATGRLTAADQARVLSALTQSWVAEWNWDDRAVGLAEEAEGLLAAADDPPPETVGEVAVLRANALLATEDREGAKTTLLEAAERIRPADSPVALLELLSALGDLRMFVDEPVPAAESYAEAILLLDDVEADLADRIQLLVSLGQARLQAKDRAGGVGALRRASSLVDSRGGVGGNADVDAFCRLAVALQQDADDGLRARAMLAAAKEMYSRLLRGDPQETGGLAALVGAVRELEGVEEAVALVGLALRETQEDPGTINGVLTLMVDAELSATEIFELVASSEEPDSVAAISLLLAEVYGPDYLNRPEEVGKVLRSAIEHLRSSGAESPGTELGLLVALSQVDETDDRGEAREALTRSLALAEAHPDLNQNRDVIKSLLGASLVEAGRDSEALDLLSTVEELDPGMAIVLAMLRIDSGDAGSAIDDLSRLAAENPSVEAYYCLALAEFNSHEHQAAFDTIAQGLSLAGPQPELLGLCSEICNDLAEYEHGAQYALAAIELDPDIPETYMSLAWALQHMGPTRAAECEAAFQAALDHGIEGSNSLYAFEGRAAARQVLGRVEESRADYEELRGKLEPGSDPWLEGWVRYSLGQYEEAAALLGQAIEDGDDSVASRFDRALCLIVGGLPGGGDEYAQVLALVNEREPRRQLAPLRVAHTDLSDAMFAHERLINDEVFQRVVADVDAALRTIEPLVVRPILPQLRSSDDDGV